MTLLLLSGNGHAQLYFKAKTITTANGLSDNRVTCFHKDSKGFMWIGTRNGLNRYDGHAVKIFRPGQGNSISNEVVNDIEEDSRGRIWVATMEGLNIYDPVTGNWECMRPGLDVLGNSIPNFIVWDIEIDKQDKVWIAPDVFEFCHYDIPSRKFVYYEWPRFARQDPRLNKYGYRSIQKFVRKNDHEYWLGTTNGLVSLDTRTGVFRFHGGGYASDIIDLRYDPASKQVFLSAERGQLFRYDEQRDDFAIITAEPEPYPSTRFRLPGRNEIWMASEKGLIKINDERAKLLLEKNIPQLSGSVLPGGIRSVFEDDDHIRWVGTMNGISIYDPSVNSSAFLPLLPVSDKEGSNLMAGVYYDEMSSSYFVCSMDPAAVFIIHSLTGEIKKITTDASGKKLSLCTRIKKGRGNNLWLLTGESVYSYDRQHGQFRVFPMPNNEREIVFRDMVEDTGGNYWFSTFNDGLYYYNIREKRFTWIEDSLFNNRGSITGLAVDEINNKLVLGTFGEGIYTFDLLTRKKTVYHETEATRDYSPLVLINSVAKDNKGGIWVSSYSGGVFRYNPGMPFDKTFTRYDMRKGLTTNNILSTCSDDDSTLWLLSGKGLSAMSLQGRFLYDLGPEQSFSFSAWGSDPRYPHDISYSVAKKQLLIGVGGGLLIYSPQRADSSLHFPLSITAVKVHDSLLQGAAVNAGSRHQLPFRSNAVTFEFAGLYYGVVQGITYEYKLEGYDNDWVNAGQNFTAVYQNLPPGNFLFHVRAKSSDGHVAGEVSGFPFRITPPFWRTAWFVLIAGLFAAAVLGWIIYSLLQKLKMERMINTFATSLYGQNTTDDIFWDTAKNCIEKLGFSDCVIYQRNESREVFIQKAAYGPKNPYRREITNVIEIPVGKGIVGTVAQTGKALVIGDTSKDPRYIVDDEKRFSEISVPVLVDGKVFAVIDSEHPRKNFYTRYHLRILRKIAAICSEKITKHLAEERLRAKIARDLHDEMGSTLTSINIISKVAMEEMSQQEKLKQYFQKIKDHSGRMMESMSDMVWVINPVNDNFGKVILRMKEFAAEILEPARINYHFTEEGQLEQVQLNLEQRKDIYMIFKEAVNNIVKYSGATEAGISLQKKNHGLTMMIRDNGKGFDTSTQSSGNGLKNMQSRAAEMGATLSIESGPGKGTVIGLELPVT